MSSASPLSTLREAIAGLVIGFDNLGRAVALSSLVFAGTLAAGGPLALLLFLASGVLGTASLLVGRFFVGPAFSNVQNATIAILLPAITAVVATSGSVEAHIATVFAIIGTSAVLTGAAMILVSTLRLGRFVQLIPFPVSSGYLAASGALLAVCAFKVVCSDGTCLIGRTPGEIAQNAPALFLTLGFALLLWVGTTILRSFGVVASLALALAGFYVALAIMGWSAADARQAGLLPAPLPQQETLSFSFGLLSEVQFDLLLQALPVILAAVVVSLFSAMLNITGVELLLRRNVDTRGELLRAGVANIFTGIFGSTTSFISASNTAAAQLMHAHGRLPGIVACVIMAAAMTIAAPMLAFVPPFLSGGLLIFFGVSILNQWWFATRHQQSLPEWLLALAIVLVSVFVSMPAAVILGIMAASLIFAISYGRIPVVRSVSDLSVLRSTVDRGRVQAQHLREHGQEVVVVSLQGYLFFGSVEALSSQLEKFLLHHSGLRSIILDCSRVSQVDASALAALRKLDFLAQSRNVDVVLAELNTRIEADIVRTRALNPSGNIRTAKTTDSAIEAAEDGLITRLQSSDAKENALSALASLLGDPVVARRLFDRMERLDAAAGSCIVTQGDEAGAVYLLEDGTLSVSIQTGNGDRLRVMKQRPGTIVGEIATYAGVLRTADVIADTDCVLYGLTPEALNDIQESDPILAAHWHRAMATSLAEKLDRTNKILGQKSA